VSACNLSSWTVGFVFLGGTDAWDSHLDDLRNVVALPRTAGARLRSAPIRWSRASLTDNLGGQAVFRKLLIVGVAVALSAV
jgi:hypothetical protein